MKTKIEDWDESILDIEDYKVERALTNAALDAIQPEDVVKSFFLGEPRREEATGVVTGSFAVASAAGECADEALFGEQANGLREIGADGASHDDEAEAIGGANEKRVVDAKVSWANVERAAFAMRNPIAVETN